VCEGVGYSRVDERFCTSFPHLFCLLCLPPSLPPSLPSQASIGAESSLSVVSHLTDTGKMPPGAPSPLSEGGAKVPT